MRVDVDRFIQITLTVGVLASLLLLVWGVIPLLHPAASQTPQSMIARFVELDANAAINLGILVLLLTPVARVAASLVAFAIERDVRFVLISILILVILAISTFVRHTV